MEVKKSNSQGEVALGSCGNNLTRQIVNNGLPQMKAYADQNISSMVMVKNEILRIHQAGIKILAGNDPPNFGINRGPMYYRRICYL